MVVFVTGGAWLIGYKAWGQLLGRMLAHLGILVFSVDYRNFPEATVKDMYQDVEAAVAWVFAHATEYGGDPERVSLCGQSAGAHLTACLLTQRAREQLGEGPATIRWTVGRMIAQHKPCENRHTAKPDLGWACMWDDRRPIRSIAASSSREHIISRNSSTIAIAWDSIVVYSLPYLVAARPWTTTLLKSPSRNPKCRWSCLPSISSMVNI